MIQDTRIVQLEKKVASLESQLKSALDILARHTHQGVDGSSKLDKDIAINPFRFFKAGTAAMTGFTQNEGTSSEINKMSITAGPTSGTVKDSSIDTEIILEHQPNALQSFFYSYRPPLYTGVASISSGGNTLTDSRWNWATNELAGAYVNVFDGTNLYTHLISSNTSSVITISDTFSFTNSSTNYIVLMPVYHGSAEYPWRRLYTATDIRFGIGASAGTKVCYIKHGTGSPESVVTAQVGSLYLRLDGGAGTTLYVKQSGTGNTGWVGK